MFKKSLAEGVFPSLWKAALIVPVHKKGSKSDIKNYRPISILNTISKVFEKIVHSIIYSVIVNGIGPYQHGFIKRRSTTSNLATFSNYVICNMEAGGQVDVIYTDFEKAFDRVDHVILLSKLQNLGIHGDLLRWVRSYLSRRSQAVVVGGYRSDFVSIPSGVPQGSLLGPLFYCAYLYDVRSCFEYAKHLLYADDMKIYLRIRSRLDCELIQRDLNSLYQYYTRNNININISKCQCISFTRCKKPINYMYSFDNKIIERVDAVRDLGVMLDSKLLFSQHVDSIVNKASRNLGFVMRTCKPFRNLHSLKIVYFAYVRSILEYCSPIWSPQYKVYNSRLEGLQKRFIKYLNFKSNKRHASYHADCSHYHLLPLVDRREMLDMLLLFDILRGKIDSGELLSCIEFCTQRSRTRHTHLFSVPSHRSNYGSNAVMTRLPRLYIDKFESLDIFHLSKLAFRKSLVGMLTDS